MINEEVILGRGGQRTLHMNPRVDPNLIVKFRQKKIIQRKNKSITFHMYFFEHAIGITLLKYNIHIGKYKNFICTFEISPSVGSLL